MSNDTPKMAIRTTSKPLATQFDILFDRTIEAPSEFHEEVYMMRQAGEGDLVNLHINSGGGALVTFSAVQHVMKQSDAHFHAILEGDASSAASMLFLIADTQEVADHAEMMIHQAQVGYGSHAQGFKGAADMVSYQNEKLVKEVYEGFLDEDEIKTVLSGGEIWLHADHIRERLEKRETIRNQQAVDEAKETYTPEVYASQCVQDITEDCQQFDYDPVKIIEAMLEEVKSSKVTVFPANVSAIEDAEPTPQLEKIHQEILENEGVDSIVDFVKETGCISSIRCLATHYKIKFAHNIGIEKLRQRILDFLGEES